MASFKIKMKTKEKIQDEEEEGSYKYLKVEEINSLKKVQATDPVAASHTLTLLSLLQEYSKRPLGLKLKTQHTGRRQVLLD